MKYAISEQDDEDANQERLINEWLKKAYPGRDELFERRHIRNSGATRSSNTFTCASLDAPLVSEDSTSGTLADLIAGSDGRDEFDERFVDEEWLKEDVLSLIKETLASLGLNKEEILWQINHWLRSPMKNEMHSLISTTDLEWEIL